MRRIFASVLSTLAALFVYGCGAAPDPTPNLAASTDPPTVSAPKASPVLEGPLSDESTPPPDFKIGDPWSMPLGPNAPIVSRDAVVAAATFTVYDIPGLTPSAWSVSYDGNLVGAVFKDTAFGSFVLHQLPEPDQAPYSTVPDGQAGKDGPTYTKVETAAGTGVIQEAGSTITVFLRIDGVQMEAIGWDASMSLDQAGELVSTLSKAVPVR